MLERLHHQLYARREFPLENDMVRYRKTKRIEVKYRNENPVRFQLRFSYLYKKNERQK